MVRPPSAPNFMSTLPLFFAPQTAHMRMILGSPCDPSRRSPQSVQNTNEPMAAMRIRFVEKRRSRSKIENRRGGGRHIKAYISQ